MVGLLAGVPPVWVLCGLIGVAAAVIVSLIRPSGISRLVELLAAGAFGAVVGQVVATQTVLAGVRLGELFVVEAALGAVASILVARRTTA